MTPAERADALARVRAWVRLFDGDPTTNEETRRVARLYPPQRSIRAVARVAAHHGAAGDAHEINALALECETHALTWREIDEAAS